MNDQKINNYDIIYDVDKIYKSIDMHNMHNMHNMKILNISNSNLVELPKEINLLDNLVFLDCGYNNITEINLTNPKLVVLDCFHNKLNKFPNISSEFIKCIHIGKNNIVDIPYKKILLMDLIVFLYYDNMIPINKKLLVLEFKRQQYLIQTLQFEYNMEKIMENNDMNKISIRMLKDVEEDIYENYYMRDFIEEN